MMLLNNISVLILLWIKCVYTQPCGEGCEDCRNSACYTCKEEYYLHLQDGMFLCKMCPDSCKMCYFVSKAVRCTLCKHGYYSTDKVCLKCHDGCAQCTSKYTCSSCKNGWWGKSCLYSCNTCNDCFEEKCSSFCKQQENIRLCKDNNSECHNTCSFAFSGPRKSDVHTSREWTTLQAESQTEGSGTTALYIVIAVVGVLVLVVVIVVVVCIIRRKRRQYQESSLPETNNEAESHQLSDNTEGHSNISHLGNAIDTIANINVAESDTGYVDMNTIDSVSTINVAESNTGFVDMNTTAYENVVDKTDINATDTVNTYEALNQYTNVREAENVYTSLTGNDRINYNVLD